MAAREASDSAWASASAARSRRSAAAGTGIRGERAGCGHGRPAAGRDGCHGAERHLEQRASPGEAGGANPINLLTPLRPWVPCCGERGDRGRASPGPASSFHLQLPRPRPQPQRIRAAGSGGFPAATAGAPRPRGHGAHAGRGQPLRQTQRRAALPSLPGPRPVSAARPSPGSPSRRRRAGRRWRHGPGAGRAVSGAGRGWRRCGRCCCCSVSAGAALRRPGVRLRAAPRGLRAPPEEPGAGRWAVGSGQRRAPGAPRLLPGRALPAGVAPRPAGCARLCAALRSEQLFAESTLLERQKIPNGRCPSAGAFSS